MSDGLNKVMLIGNLGDDPELKYTQGGTALLKLSLATTETYFDKDKEKKQRTAWHRVTVWGKRAEGLNKCDLAKGSRIYVEGRIEYDSYEDREGVKRYTTNINALNVILLGGGKRSESRGEESQDGGPDYDPSGAGQGSQFDDDVPF